jgi:hypothetical protein
VWGKLRTSLWCAMSLFCVAWTVAVAGAGPPQYCRDLAAQFGTAPGQLDANALSVLGACVTAEIQRRSGGRSRPAPPGPEPDASGRSPIDEPGWGGWPKPPAWSDGGGKPQPWDDFKNP